MGGVGGMLRVSSIGEAYMTSPDFVGGGRVGTTDVGQCGRGEM